MNRALRLVLACLAPASVAACSMLPATGPTSEELIKKARTENTLGYKIIDVTPALIPIVTSAESPPLTPMAPAGNIPNKIGVDDVLQITVFETGIGLFSSGVVNSSTTISGNAIGTTLPAVTVASDGAIAIPYVGRVHAAGVTVEDLREYIENTLVKSKFASQPQVVVTLMNNVSNTVFVDGDVKNPGRYPLTQTPERLLDVVTLAGSSLHLPYDTVVTLTRGDSQQRTSLGALDALSSQNVRLESGDRIYVAYEPRTYTVFGASLRPSEISFDTQRVTLAQALARANGLDDSKADPAGVYLFRFERADIAKQLGVDASGPIAPVIYRLNLRDPAAFFTVQQFPLRDHDLIYITDAKGAQLRKFLELVSAMFSPLSTAGAVSNLAR